jgi:hypothetical protein
MGEVGCVGRAIARVWAGECGCTGKCGGRTLLWLNSKLISKICVCVKLVVMLVYSNQLYTLSISYSSDFN